MSDEIHDKMVEVTNTISEALKRAIGDRKVIFISVFHDVESNLFTIATNYNDPEAIRSILQATLTRVENQISESDDEVRH